LTLAFLFIAAASRSSFFILSATLSKSILFWSIFQIFYLFRSNLHTRWCDFSIPKNIRVVPGVTHMTWAGDQQTKSSSGSYYSWQPSFAFFWWVLFLKNSKPFAWEENSFLTILQLIFCRHPRSSSHLNSHVACFHSSFKFFLNLINLFCVPGIRKTSRRNESSCPWK